MATYYWVGGSGTWNGASTTNWSASSGGAGGAGVPDSADTVIFDDNSGTGTATTASGAVCANLTMNSTNLVLKLGANLTAGTSTTLTKGTINLDTFTYTTPDFSSNNSNTRSIQFGTGKINVTGNGGTIWNFATLTNFSYTGTPTVELSYAGGVGSRILNHGFLGGGSETTAVSFNVTAGTDTISANPALYIKNFDFTGFSGTLANLTISLYGNLKISSGMTVNAGTSVMTFAATSGTQQVTSSGKTLDFPITINAVGATVQLQDALTQGSTRAFTLTNGTLQLKNGATATVGTFATSGTNQKFLQSTSAGSKGTLSQATGTVNASYLSVKDVAATGGAIWNALTACVNQQNNSGWFFSYQQGRPLPALSF